jgi:hydrogenase nickel incorporation protein HypA/HybF
MHEEALLRDLRRKLVEIARREHVERISRVALWVGALAHVSEETLRTRWDGTVEGTPAEHAGLEIQFSSDLDDPRAQGIVITHVDVTDSLEDPSPGPPGARRFHEGAGPAS